jgi:dUTP pyrophosphatase
MSATSPPTSPLPKRQKPNPSIMSTTNSIPAVTKVDAQPPLLIKKLSDKARLPTRGSAFAAGYDIYAAKDTVVPARGKVLVDTDISMAVPAGTCMFANLSGRRGWFEFGSAVN